MKKILETVFGTGPQGCFRLASAVLRGLPEYEEYKRRFILGMRNAVERDGRFLPDVMKEFFGYRSQITGRLQDIPQSGPLLVIANHPTMGPFDGFTLGEAVYRIRADFKMIGDGIFHDWPLERWILPVRRSADDTNLEAVRKGLAHMEGGGCLGLLPAKGTGDFTPDTPQSIWPPFPAKLILNLNRKGLQPAFVPALMTQRIISWSGMTWALERTAGFLEKRGVNMMALREMGTIFPPREIGFDFQDSYRVSGDRVTRVRDNAVVLDLPKEKPKRVSTLLDFMKRKTYRTPENGLA